MKTVIIYFSEIGKTKTVAKALSKNLDTDLVEVRDLKNRRGLVSNFFLSIDAFREKKQISHQQILI